MNEVDELLLEHFGVKGMHWGVHNKPRTIKTAAGTNVSRRRGKVVRKQQKSIDRLRRLEVGKGSKTDKFIASMFQIPTVNLHEGIQGGAHLTLERKRIHKKKILSGKRKVRDLLDRFAGINVRDLNVSRLR